MVVEQKFKYDRAAGFPVAVLRGYSKMTGKPGDGGSPSESTRVTVERPPDLTGVSREEARRTLEEQLRVLEDIDTKAVKVLRVNVVLIGLVLTTVSITVRAGRPIEGLLNGYFAVGLGCLLASTAVAALTYTTTSMRAGIDADDLRYMLDNDLPDGRNVEELVYSYADWIEFNYETNVRSAPLGTLTVLLLAYAVTFFSFGVFETFPGPSSWPVSIATVCVLLAFTWLTGFPRQARRFYRVADPFAGVRTGIAKIAKIISERRTNDEP